MSVSVKTYVLLWKRAANRCAFHDCRDKELVVDAMGIDVESLIGEACRIIARSRKGPRGEAKLTSAQRDSYSNLILLCRNHHKTVDDQRRKYSPDVLRQMKSEHETWVRKKLRPDPVRQADEERYADIIDEWATRLKLKTWTAWTSPLLSHGQPSLRKRNYERIVAAKQWLFNRV